MIAKIIMNTIINMITKQVTNTLGDTITFQSVLKLCVLGGGVMFFVLGFDIMTIAIILVLLIGIGSYYIYFKKGITPLTEVKTEDKNLQNLNTNLEEKSENDPSLLLRFPELDSLLESLNKISKELGTSEDEMDKKQNANLIDMTNSLLEETTNIYQQMKDDKRTQPVDDQKINDIVTELKIELNSVLVKYEDESNTEGQSIIQNYKTVLDELLLKFKKKN